MSLVNVGNNMSNLHVKALEILNNYSTIAARLHSYHDYENRGGYIYFDTEEDAFQVELEAIRIDGVSLERHLRSGGSLDATEVAELVLEQNPYKGVPEKYTPEDVVELVEHIKNNFWYNYHLILGLASNVKKELKQLNEEAGKTLVNIEIIDALLQGPQEFYESSRCW